MTNEITKSPDSNVEKNREALLQRSIAGLAKYGVTTAIAAENTGRKWVCIEQSEEYATKAVERIQNHQCEEKPASEVKIDSDIPVPEGEENGN